MRNQIVLHAVIFLAFIITGCGGGGGNQAPTAENVTITDDNAGTPEVGDNLTGSYTYADAEDDTEDTSTFRWLRSNTAISGATSSTYALVAEDLNKNIAFEVTPIATTGKTDGTPTLSSNITVGNEATIVAAQGSRSYSIDLNTSLNFKLGNADVTLYQYSITTQPTNGTVIGQTSGQHLALTYTPEHDYVGADSIGFTVTHESGVQATGVITINILNQIDGMRDTDGDGISDLDESNFYGTSPVLADTDADGFSDFTEIFTYGFDASVNNFRFNPLIADIPQIDIELVSAPDIFMNYTQSDGTSTSISTSRSESSSSTVTSSESTEKSTSFEHSHTWGLSLGATGGFLHGVLSYEGSIGYGQESSNSWTEEQSQENSTALDQGKAFEESKSIATSGGGMNVNVRITNRGNISYRLTNLYLNASYLDLSRNNPAVPIGNLVFENQFVSEFPSFTLAPGESSGLLTYTTAELSIDTTRNLLKDSQGLSIRPAIFDLINQNNSSYTFNQTGIKAQDATVIVDFGGFNANANLTKLIATNADPQNNGISIADALQNVMQLHVGIDATNGFISGIEDANNYEPKGYWVMLHAAQSGNNKTVTTIYTTPTDESRIQSINSGITNLVSNYDINNIRLHGGDTLHLLYLLDDDLDGLSNRDEFFYRTDIINPDSDGDDLSDFAEVSGWKVSYTEITGSPVEIKVTSDPLNVDTDGDQISDLIEANIGTSDITLKRNPRSADTDGDGISDLTDDKTGVTYLANIYDKIDIENFTVALTTPASGAFSPVKFSYDTLDVTETGTVPGTAGNGITQYEVHVYRHSASDSIHPEPLTGPTDFIPASVGQNISCGTGCNWELVHIGNNIPGATGSGIQTDPTNISVGNAGLFEDYKYIAYLRIDNRYYLSSQSASAAANMETVTIHMMSGNLNNVKSMSDDYTKLAKTGTIYYSAEHNELFYETGYDICSSIFTFEFCIIGNVYNAATGLLKRSGVYFEGSPTTTGSNFWIKPSSYSAGYVTDAVAANDLPPYTHPMIGDGYFDLNWQLYFDGELLAQRNVPDFLRAVCGSLQSRRTGHVITDTKNNLTTTYLNDFNDLTGTYSWYDNDCSDISSFADDGNVGATGGGAVPNSKPTGYTLNAGGAAFSVTLPAIEACYPIHLLTYEYNRSVNAYSNVYNPSSSDPAYANADLAKLCRLADGSWKITADIKLNNEHDLGRPISQVTTAASPNPIQYKTRTMRWKDVPGTSVRTTKEGDLTVRYDISVTPL